MDRLPGQCTVSKLDAFDLFQSNTSPYAVIAILLLTPLPCLIINLLIECIPLNRPSAGFWASGCFQLRLFWAGFFSSLMPSLKKVDCVPGSPGGSPRELLLFAASQACIGVITNAIISVAADVFPVPFSQFTPIIPMTIVGRLLFYRHLPEDPQFHAQSNKVNLWVSVEVLPVLIYPAFTVAFMALTSTQQFWVLFLLPLVKVAIRRVLWWITRDDHDLIGVMTFCVGHLYHVLFIAMVLQNSKSLDTIGVVVVAGVMKMLLNCYYILADSKDLFAATIKLDCAIQQREDYCSAALRIAQDACVANELNNSVPSLLLSTYPRYRRLEFLTRYEGVLKPVTSVQDKRLKLASVVPWSALPQRASHGTVYLVMAMSRLRKNQTKKLPRAWVPTASEGATSRRKAYVNKFAYAMHQSQIVLLKSYVTICMTSFYGT
ncbi:unnamed protein product [Phytophthora lilii]|uniref:Unnamed protein product n=1 Tax=Phytophthora lilii TaxID=2077276 RepID=A0A9W6U2E7_9STRA|nr:unnamed protein product [Phytophthora lilii]